MDADGIPTHCLADSKTQTEDVHLVEFMYLVFTRMPVKVTVSRFRSNPATFGMRAEFRLIVSQIQRLGQTEYVLLVEFTYLAFASISG